MSICCNNPVNKNFTLQNTTSPWKKAEQSNGKNKSLTQDKVQSIANASFSEQEKTFQRIGDISIFSKSVVAIPKEKIAEGGFKKVYTCAMHNFNSQEFGEAAYLVVTNSASTKNAVEDAIKEDKILQVFKDCKQIVKPYTCSGEYIDKKTKKRSFHAVTKLYKEGDLYKKGLSVTDTERMGAIRTDLSFLDTLQVGYDIAYGLAEVHEKKYIHSDLKPENILLSREKRAFLADFGLAFKQGKLINGGTPDYLPPEVWCAMLGVSFANKKELLSSPTIDIWSTGVILCELFAPEVLAPFWENLHKLKDETRSTSERTSCLFHMEIDKNALQKSPLDIEIKNTILRCLAYNPRERCSAKEIRDNLEKVLNREKQNVELAC